jgi:hypothetical protein
MRGLLPDESGPVLTQSEQTDVLTRVKQLGQSDLLPLVRGILDDDSASPKPGWTAKPIGGSVGLGTLGIFHISGEATTNSDIAEWSVVAKVMDLEAVSNQQAAFLHISPTREVLAYESGLVESITSESSANIGFRAAKHYGVTEIADLGSILWVEDLSKAPPPPWGDEIYTEIARQIGRFNANWELNPPDRQSWFVEDILTVRLEPQLVGFGSIGANLDDPLVKLAFPPDNLKHFESLSDTLPSVISVLSQGSNPLSHLDAQPRNLFPVPLENGGIETVAIDWASVGYAPMGMDAPLVVGSSMTWYEFDAEHGTSLHVQAMAGFIDGLADMDWQGDTGLVRLAYMTGALMRAAGNVYFTSRWVNDAEWKKTVTGLTKTPADVLAKHWGDVFAHVYPLFEKELTNSGL